MNYPISGRPQGSISSVYICGWIWFLFKIESIRAWKTYKANINGLKREMASRFMDCSVWERSDVLQVIQGLHKTIGRHKLLPQKKFRGACTNKILKRLLPFWRRETLSQRNILRLAIVSFDKALRLGEVAKTQHNKGKVPKLEDLKVVDKNYVKLSIKTKTDTWFDRTVLEIRRNMNYAQLCAVKAIRECVEECHQGGDSNKPLFCDEKGDSLTDKAIIVELHHALEQSGISKTGFRTKVFRRGRTQDVVRTGAEEEEIKLIGRWASNCWKTYAEEDVVSKQEDVNVYLSKLRSIIRLVEA